MHRIHVLRRPCSHVTDCLLVPAVPQVREHLVQHEPAVVPDAQRACRNHTQHGRGLGGATAPCAARQRRPQPAVRYNEPPSPAGRPLGPSTRSSALISRTKDRVSGYSSRRASTCAAA